MIGLLQRVTQAQVVVAGETVGRAHSITYFHVPPLAIADVR